MASKDLYIQLFSIHGLIRGQNLELGRDTDTGGQTKYVLELASALGRHPRVRKVDLFTRLVRDKTVSSDYAKPVEQVSGNVRIVRIQCGGGKYLRKELLWPHLDEYVDKTLKFAKDEGELPDIVHGHYADGGYVASELTRFWGVPFIFTAHSLGWLKKQNLAQQGFSEAEMDKKYRLHHRLQVEEEVLGRAELIITSTRQEIEKQYRHYESCQNAQFCVIPPGIDNEKFFPFYELPEDEEARDAVMRARYFVQQELERFFTSQEKPLILALSRPDHHKNIAGLITAYGRDNELKAIANLAVFAGIRKDIAAMDENEQEVLTELLLLMDKFDLYGKLAIPKRHEVEHEVPALYRLAARSNGVFVNPSFRENFGLTLIEAAATGLPIVGPLDGGPRDIVENCQNGLLVDTHDPEAISSAIKEILIDPDRWKKFSQNGIEGVRDHYVWDAHCQKYIEQLGHLLVEGFQPQQTYLDSEGIGKRFTNIHKFFISDIDDTLIGDREAIQQLSERLAPLRERIGFGVATGREARSALQALRDWNAPAPDIIISSVGTEIYYGSGLMPDRGWKSHISYQWQREEIRQTLQELPFLEMQEDPAQREFKLSYYMDADNADDQLAAIHRLLADKRLRYYLIYSRSRYLDILPYRASKGKAIRYLSYKWNIPLGNILVAGDTDNDEEMLRGEMLGVVVGNYSPELEKLRGLHHVYFADAHYAAGILEGFEYYDFLE